MAVLVQSRYWYKIKRVNVNFFALMRTPEMTEKFIEIKKRLALDDPMVGCVVGAMAWSAKVLEFTLVTTAPTSRDGVHFSEEIAKRVAAAAGLPYRKLFGRSNRLPGYKPVSEKLKMIQVDIAEPVAGKRILIVDDFAYTGRTMSFCIRSLARDNDVMGVAVCATQ